MQTVPAGSTWSNRTVDGKFFKNLGSERTPKVPFMNMVKWQWQRLTNDQRRKPVGGYEAFQSRWCKPCDVAEELRQKHASHATVSSDYVYWLGHASTLLCLASGVNVLFDPIFSKCAAPYSFLGFARRLPPPCTIAQLPCIDLVAISHNHYDHLDERSIRDLFARFPQIQFCVPLQMDSLLCKWGIPASQIHSLDWWEEKELCNGNVRVSCTPAQHWSLRWPGDRNKVLWCGWYLTWPPTEYAKDLHSENSKSLETSTTKSSTDEVSPNAMSRKPANMSNNSSEENSFDKSNAPSEKETTANMISANVAKSKWSKNIKSFYFAGDTAFNALMFDEIHRRFPHVDMAALPIGAYSPRWFMSPQHMDPAQSVEVFQRLHAKRALAIHWGTFELADDPLDEPPEVLRDALTNNNINTDRFCTIPMGTSLAF